MKICKDCKWVQPTYGLEGFWPWTKGYRFATCGHPHARVWWDYVDKVTGKHEVGSSQHYCSVMRASPVCGKMAFLFEEKK